MDRDLYEKEMISIGLDAVNMKYVSTVGGNMSTRFGENFLITATGVSLGDLGKSGSIVLIDRRGNLLEDVPSKPSQESPIHLACYEARPDINAVVHLHPLFSTTLASIDEEIACLSFEQRFFLQNGYKVLPPLPPGSEKLKNAVASAIKDCDVLILKNHGCFSVGTNLKEAYYRIVDLENAAIATVIAKVYGKAIRLPDNP
ncbi:MAG: class II aldolase/adducin family protein [Thermoplasmatales archaeon]